MAYTQAQLDALKDALASGHLTINRGDLRVTFRSVDELQQAITTVEDELSAGTAAARPTFRLAKTSKGL